MTNRHPRGSIQCRSRRHRSRPVCPSAARESSVTATELKRRAAAAKGPGLRQGDRREAYGGAKHRTNDVTRWRTAMTGQIPLLRRGGRSGLRNIARKQIQQTEFIFFLDTIKLRGGDPLSTSSGEYTTLEGWSMVFEPAGAQHVNRRMD